MRMIVGWILMTFLLILLLGLLSITKYIGLITSIISSGIGAALLIIFLEESQRDEDEKRKEQKLIDD